MEAEGYAARLVDSGDGPALARLFEQAGSTCYCRYWHFEGDKNDWLDRLANHPDENRAELDRALAAGGAEALGIVAETVEGEIVGWLKLSPATLVIKPYQQRYYRSLPCFAGDRDGVYLVACVLVHPMHRREGVARALVSQAMAIANERGGRALEALPRRALERVTDEELWMGPLAVFQSLGFVEVHRSGELPVGQADPYPVLRYEITRRDG